MRAEIKEKLEENKQKVAEEAAKARWDRIAVFKKAISVDWQDITTESAQELLALMLEAYQEGARIVQFRLGTNSAKTETCHQCKKEGLKKWTSCRTVRNKAGLPYNIFFCSPQCDGRYQTATMGGIIR